MSWKSVEPLLHEIGIHANPGNQPVTVTHMPSPLEVVGIGTDAVVVRHPEFPGYVFKVFVPERDEARKAEYEVYRRLGSSPYFPVCYGTGERYLVLSYEPGITLYDCLVQGVEIPESIIWEVEQAREYARSRGLNPRDIHLKNVLLQNGHAKLLDVSEYIQPGNDGRWDHLVQGYYAFYPLIAGKKIPVWLIEMVKKAYYDEVLGDFSIKEFGGRFLQMFMKKGKRS
ncbi:serine/threonine protein kinase [Marinithermofilum abyssi]|uniref:Serine/threonine protein kinase n=1 Tax=Marinithermofilum abyssi TaxID=1571185 RepID=A0A8J2VIY7_9BACL|nr:serine/threonine protein kinase [Marinithermofilum abyssi]GGE20110.1 serine/threonine protein kinase [Marinithermofilum abyssi]